MVHINYPSHKKAINYMDLKNDFRLNESYDLDYRPTRSLFPMQFHLSIYSSFDDS